jgi:hypothetical protein
MGLSRTPCTTVTFVDHYCAAYQHLFPEVRSFENFKFGKSSSESSVMARLKFAILANSSLVNGELAATGLLTTEPNQLPDNSTWFVMSNLPDVIPSEVGNTYRLRTWIEYGLQLIIQPYIYYCLLRPWLKVFENWHLRVGFSWLMAIMNEFSGYLLLKHLARDAQPTVSFSDEYCAGTILSCHFL